MLLAKNYKFAFNFFRAYQMHAIAIAILSVCDTGEWRFIPKAFGLSKYCLHHTIE